MLLDVIYVNYNSTKYLINSIESLYNNKGEKKFQLIVVDNSSEDDPCQLNKLFPKINLVLNRHNNGFGAAINQALKYCLSKYIILLNPDSLVTERFLETSIRIMEQDDHIGIMGPTILDEDGGIQGSARAFPTPLTSLFGRNSPITKMFPNNSITKSNILTLQHDQQNPMEVDWVSGACMVVRREAMQAVGGFDERFFLYWEDTDLCRRIRDAGWKVVYFPGAKVIHSVGKSSGTRPVFANYQFHKSCYQLYVKYTNWPLSLFTPIAGMALMVRFLIAVLFNQANSLLKRLQAVQNQRKKRSEKESKVKVLRVVSRLNIGGPSLHVKNLTEGLDPVKYDTRLIAGSLSPNEGDMSYLISLGHSRVFTISELQRELHPIKDFFALIKLLKIIKQYNPHIVHSHLSKAGTISRIAVFLCNRFRRNKIKTVHTFHGHVLDAYFNNIKTRIFQIIEWLLGTVSDRIIAISDTQKWELSKKFKVADPSKISLINLGFDLNPFVQAHKLKGKLRRKLGVSDDTLLIGLIGRMAPIKNHKMFLDAANYYLEKSKDKNVKFIIVGDGELRQSLELYSLEIGLKDHIIFYGWEKNIPMIYADLDILALTSLNEGTPVSIIEAMAASVPVVTTGVGGIKDLLGRIEPDQHPDVGFKICERGILCPKDDAIVFSTAIKYIIDNDYLFDSGRLSKAGNFVLENYSVGRLIHDIDVLYKRLLTGGRCDPT